jgi:hypothetical protein
MGDGPRPEIRREPERSRSEYLKPGLASHARNLRAAELARDADLRLNPPQSKANTTTLPPVDQRLPPPGTILTRPYKGQLLQVQVLTEGFAYAGRVYASLSAVAKAITGSHTNGFLFFRNILNNNKEST